LSFFNGSKNSYLSPRVIDSFPRILYKIIKLTSFFSSEGPKALANKTGINFIVFSYSWKFVCNTMRYMIFQHDEESKINLFRSHIVKINIRLLKSLRTHEVLIFKLCRKFKIYI